MKSDKRKQLAKIAYLYFIEDMSQEQIAKHLGIYRTTISRMLTQAKQEGIVQIKIEDFNPELLKLETIFKEKYGLKNLEIASSSEYDTEEEKDEKLSVVASQWLRKNIHNDYTVGLAWGASIGKAVEKITPKYLENTSFVPLVGGPSRINSKYHINTLVYELARKFHGESIFVNASVVQESKQLAEGIFNSKYFEEIKDKWNGLNMVIVGVGGVLSYRKSQWRDLLNEEDYVDLKLREAVGDCCCRFFDREGKVLNGPLNHRTIGLPLEYFYRIETRVAIARGKAKVRAIRALIKKGYINTLLTDQETLMSILTLDKIQL